MRNDYRAVKIHRTVFENIDNGFNSNRTIIDLYDDASKDIELRADEHIPGLHIWNNPFLKAKAVAIVDTKKHTIEHGYEINKIELIEF